MIVLNLVVFTFMKLSKLKTTLKHIQTSAFILLFFLPLGFYFTSFRFYLY